MHRLREAAEAVVAACGAVPGILVVAGSGLGGFAGTLADRTEVSYEDLPHFPASAVAGHAGRLVFGRAGQTAVAVMSGRKHLYEGVDALDAVLPLRALVRAGVRTVILSNAAGALNEQFDVGDLMLIRDQINWQFRNPLLGPNLDALGGRFPDMSEPYSRELGEVALAVARVEGIPLREGIYIGNLGPTYETRAEVRMLKAWGDVVGMSTVAETIAAVHAGARVLGITLVSNTLVRGSGAANHEEVMEAGRAAAATFNRLVAGIIGQIAED